MQTTTPISTCQAPGCTNTFPTHANAYQIKKYCTRKCQNRASEASSRRQAYYRTEAGRAAAKRKREKYQAKKRIIKQAIRETHIIVQPCPNCDTYFVSQQPRLYCTPKCNQQAKNKKISQEKARERAARTCKTCGQPGVRQRFCSSACHRKHPENRKKRNAYRSAFSKTPAGQVKKRERKHTRQARKRNAFVEIVSVHKLAKAQNWSCWLCGGKISKTAKAPHPDSLSLDHLVPLSLGGEHSYANCAAAHFRCNALKSNNAVNEQLKLPIPGLIA
jgi:hypothetical protein